MTKYVLKIEGADVKIERSISSEECRRIMSVVLSAEAQNEEELRNLAAFTTALRKSGLNS